MPLGMGYTVEGQLTGEEKHGGIQIQVFEPKPGLFSDTSRHERRYMNSEMVMECCEAASMGLGAGGKMKQDIYPDPHGVETWDTENFGKAYIHIVNSMDFREITGLEPPVTPISARDERDYLREVFIRMLLHSEERGPHASGLAWLKTDGNHRIFKRPMRAHELVYEKPFQELLGQVDNETTVLMGHTRWRTRGNEFNNRNNHPIRAGIVIGTHNGTIYNADYLFRRLGLPRYAEVDSELIFRLADRFAPEGPIDQEGLKKALALCRGQMSAVLASRLDPGTITVLKGNKPLCLRIHRQHRVVLYASDDTFIDFAVDNEKGWRELEVPPMTMLTIRHADVRAIENSEFRFIPQERKGTLPEGVIA